MLDYPLHDTEIVKHLHACNKENDDGEHIDEEPVLCFDSILVKEKGSTDETLVREI